MVTTICLPELLMEWRLSLLAESKRDKTIRVYLDGVGRFGAYCGPIPVDQVTKGQIQGYLIARREAGLSSYTVNQDYRNLRCFFNWCRREAYLTESPLTGLHAPAIPHDLPKVLTPDQVALLLRVAGRGPRGARDATLMRFLLDTGLRVSEVANLDLADVDLEQGTVLVRHGKGQRTRIVPIGTKVRLGLHRYIRGRYALPGEKALFTDRVGKRLAARGIQMLVRRLNERLPFHLHAHLLRHTFATEYLRAGGDLETLRRILGHSSLEVTQIYLHLVESDLVRAHRSFSPGDRF